MIRHAIVAGAIAGMLISSGTSAFSQPSQVNCGEPDIKTALSWWPPARGVWTPIGWKDHLFRFDVFYNGTLLCPPAAILQKPHVAKYRGQDFQLNFTANEDGALPPLPTQIEKLYKLDGGFGVQRWREGNEAPVLQTDYPSQAGIVMRSEIFAHIPGGQDIKTGTEPLYAWVRLSVAHVDPIRAPQKFYFAVQLSKIYYPQSGSIEDSVFFPVNSKMAPLSSTLTSHTVDNDGLVVEQDGKVRLQVLPDGDGIVSLAEATTGVYNLKVELPAREGAHADLLVPMLVMDKGEIARESALTFDGALAEAEKYWSAKPETAANIHTPEKYINDALKRNVQFAEVVAERNPDNGEYSFLSGSYGYDALWSTPTSMVSHMFLDLLGYHDVVEKHIALYKANQGTVKPPGDVYTTHPGYFSTPKTLTSIDWLSDHGAVLETLSRHALLTGRTEFIDQWLDPILRGLDFIKDSCAFTGHTGVKGLMPPAVATDSVVPMQAVWIQAWIYKGLVTSVQLLQRLGHPRAQEFATLADNFRNTFKTAFAEKTESEPQWTDAAGTNHHLLATNLTTSTIHHVYDDAFLLDTGPLVLPWSGLLDAGTPEMESFTEFFRNGPNNLLRGPQTDAISRAVLSHEISSCEPCYSWNIVNSWKTGNREKFLEGMYSLLTGAISTQTYINCEHRNNMYGNVFVAPLMTWCIRQAVVDDQLADGELHLLRICPLAWVSDKEQTIFENMPTNYGPVSLKWQLEPGGKTLRVDFASHWRDKAPDVLLHVPPIPGLESVNVNGKTYGITGPIKL